MKKRPEQQALERLDVRLEGVPVLGPGQEHAGEKGAQRHGHAGRRHQLRDADHQQQREGREELAHARLRDEPHRRPREVAADHDHPGHRGKGDAEALPVARAGGRRAGREQGDERDERDGRDVLEQEDGEGRAAGGRGELVALRHRLHGDRGGRQREGEARDEGGLPRQPQREERAGERHAAHGELQRPAAEDLATHGEQPLRIELEPDHEEHQHHAQLREVQRLGDVADESEPPGADRRAGNEVAEHRSQPQPRRERHDEHGGGQVDERLGHRGALGTRVPPCLEPGAEGRGGCRERVLVTACAPCTTCGGSQFMPQIPRRLLDRRHEIREGMRVPPRRRERRLVAPGRHHPEAVLARERAAAFAIGPPLHQHGVEPVLEHARHAIPVQGMQPHDEAGLRERLLLRRGVDVEVGVAVVEGADRCRREAVQGGHQRRACARAARVRVREHHQDRVVRLAHAARGARSARACAPQELVRGHACEDRESDPVIVAEGAEATFARAVADPVDVHGGDRRCRREAGEIGEPVALRIADARHRQDEETVADHHRHQVVAAEEDGRRLDADAQVVVAVDHRVLGVVGQHPEEVGRPQLPRERAARRPSAQRRPWGCRTRSTCPATPAEWRGSAW